MCSSIDVTVNYAQGIIVVNNDFIANEAPRVIGTALSGAIWKLLEIGYASRYCLNNTEHLLFWIHLGNIKHIYIILLFLDIELAQNTPMLHHGRQGRFYPTPWWRHQMETFSA